MAEPSKPDQGKNVISHAIKSFLIDVILWGAVKSVWSAVTDVFVKQPAKQAVGAQVGDEHKSGDKHTFADAMSRLAPDQPESAKTIREFLRTLKNLDERTDFMVNAAKTGEGVEGTCKFLRTFAALPNDAARRKYLEDISFIGEGEQDFFEKHASTIEHVKTYLRDEIQRTERRRNRDERRTRFWLNYRRLKAERSNNIVRRGINKTLDVLFAR